MAISDQPGDMNLLKRPNRISSFSDNQSPSAPAGTQRIASGAQLMPAQQKEQAQSAQRQVMGQRIAQTRESVGSAVGNAASAVGKGYGLMADIASTVPRAAARVGGGIAERGITFDSNLPGQDFRDRNNAIQAKNFVRDNPEQAAAGDQYGQDVSERTRVAGLRTPQPSPLSITSNMPQLEQAGRPVAPESMSVPRAVPVPAQSGAVQAPAIPAAGQATAQTSSRMLPDNAQAGEWGNVGYGGIVGRRNEQGVEEFSNMQGDVDSAAGRRFADPNSNVGNGRGGLSIMSGAEEAMARNNRATQIMQERRQLDVLERQNPNYVTVIRDTGASGVQGIINQRLNDRDAAARAQRRADHQDRIERGRNRLAELTLTRENQNMARQQMDQTEQRNQLGDQLTQQQITRGALQVEDQSRLRNLQRVIADPNAGEVEKQRALRALRDLTSSGRDRYVTVVGGQNERGYTQASRVFDTATQQFVEGSDGGAPSQPAQAAADALRRNPDRAAEFDQKYGPGAASRILGS